MKTYQSEIEDGVAEKIKANNSLAIISTVLPYTPTDKELQQDQVFAIEAVAENKDQVDLYYLTSVLVSTGWNENDDVFDPKELWTARNTPEDKQFNFMHNEDDIIGHITSNSVKDFQGTIIDSLSDQIPDQFEIVTSAVLYKSWSSSQKAERMTRLIQEIEEGKWFVSMECLFNNFDYAVIAPDGGNKMVARNENSAFLTKHLRSYGGNGEYEGFKLGRLLRNIAFSGKGLVDKPANPRSIILRTNSPFKDTNASEIQDFIIHSNSKGEKNMADDNTALLQKQIDELKQELAAANQNEEGLRAQLAEMDEKAVSDQVKKFKDEIQAKDETIAAFEEAKEAWNTEKENLSEKLTEKSEEFDAIQAKLDEIQAKAHKDKRLAALVKTGLTDEEAEAKLEVFAEVSDEIFAEVITLLTEETIDEETEAMPVKKYKKGGEVKDEEDEEDEEEDAADASADTESLEDVEEETEAALAVETDEVQSARAGAIDWMRTHVLKSTANINDNE